MAHHKITQKKGLRGPGLGELPEISGFPFNIYTMAEASDVKFGTQLGFAKTHHKITPRGKSVRGLGLGKHPNIWGFPLIFLQRPRCPISVSGASCWLCDVNLYVDNHKIFWPPHRQLLYAFWSLNDKGHRQIEIPYKRYTCDFLLVINFDVTLPNAKPSTSLNRAPLDRGDSLRTSSSNVPCIKVKAFCTLQWKPRDLSVSRFVTIHSRYRRQPTFMGVAVNLHATFVTLAKNTVSCYRSLLVSLKVEQYKTQLNVFCACCATAVSVASCL